MYLVACQVNTNPCPQGSQYLLDSASTELLINGGFHLESFEIAFAGVLGLWAVGFGIGLIIAQVRKLRAP